MHIFADLAVGGLPGVKMCVYVLGMEGKWVHPLFPSFPFHFFYFILLFPLPLLSVPILEVKDSSTVSGLENEMSSKKLSALKKSNKKSGCI